MKKKLIFIFIILAIIGIAVGVTAIINSQTHNKGPISAFGYETTIKSKPTDGTTISDYDSYDNLAIVAGLMADSNFHGETVGEVKAKVAFINYTQSVNNIRTVIDDRAFQEAVHVDYTVEHAAYRKLTVGNVGKVSVIQLAAGYENELGFHGGKEIFHAA